jgi:hypothetical protein
LSVDAVLLVAAGIAAGVCGAVAGLASLVSYPALLAYGLPPLTANVTNTSAMVATAVGAVTGSREELRGQARRVVVLAIQMAMGGLAGALLLLSTPSKLFEAAVPWLIAFASALLLCRDSLRRKALTSRRRLGGRSRATLTTVSTLGVGTYAGYFGAGAGVMLLAALAMRHSEPLAVTNAVKNAGNGAANLVATGVYLVAAPVDLAAAALLGVGLVLGGAMGPGIVRLLPQEPLRYSIALAGFGLAGWLLLG